MDVPEDDVGIELMNETFHEMGLIVKGEDGYHVSQEFKQRIQAAVEKKEPGADPEDPVYREVVLEELADMGIPAGFEPILANWVIHAIRIERWD